MMIRAEKHNTLSIDDTPDKHLWSKIKCLDKIGSDSIVSDRCVKCGCIRETIKSYYKGIDGRVFGHVSYERSGIIYSSISPKCFGNKNPK